MATMATMQSSSGKSIEMSARARWASICIQANLRKIQHNAPEYVLPTNRLEVDQFFPAKDSLSFHTKQNRKLRVGIVGAGAAGLFTAMIFDHLKDEYGLEVDYEILEASNRVGGRLYSHYFDKEPHNYYDVGAMRFPENKVMKRTFELFEVLKMHKYRDSRSAPKGGLIPYYLNGPNQPSLYNSIQVVSKDSTKQLTARDFNIPDLPLEIMDKSASGLIDKAIKVYTDLYNRDESEFWERLMNEADAYSVRQYLAKTADYNYNTIEFLETMNYGNRWYDQALSEMILEHIDFDAKPEDWWCVEGGAYEIARRMQNALRNQQNIHFEKIVTAMSYVNEEFDQINVTVKGEQNPRTYDAVLNSVPLGAMQHMQLEGLNLNWGTKSAIRSLGYGASCKVGVLFKDLWWIKYLGISRGGQAKTDLPIRCCVYPSYNIHDYDPERKVDKSGVLLVSYTWSQEAERIGALINRDSPEGENELKEVIIHDLARLHAKTKDEDDYQRLHKIISDAWLKHHAYNWYADPRTVGAFAYFGPGQFKNMYPFVTDCDGKHIIIGEAASKHHAWVVGALESAVHGVYHFLTKHAKVNDAARRAAAAYEKGEIKMPYGQVPKEFDRTENIDLPEGTAPAAIGDLARLQVLFESIRLMQGGDVIVPEKIKKEQIADIIAVGA